MLCQSWLGVPMPNLHSQQLRLLQWHRGLRALG